MDFIKNSFSRRYSNFFDKLALKGKERPEQTKLCSAKLRAVLVTFGSSENLIVDSAQCFEKYSKFFEISSNGS